MAPTRLPPNTLRHLQKQHAERQAQATPAGSTPDQQGADSPSSANRDVDALGSPSTPGESGTAGDAGYLRAAGRGMKTRLRAAAQGASTHQQGALPATGEKNESAIGEKTALSRAVSALVTSIKSNPATYSVVLGAVALGGWTASKSQTSLGAPPLPEPQRRANPSEVIDAYLRNGTFGTLKADVETIDGVTVSRGADSSFVFMDPNNPPGGLILCPKAMQLFNKHKNDPQYQSDQGRFKLAMMAAIKIRKTFLEKPVMGREGQNDLASIHVADSKAVPGGSPFLSLTLNDPVAGYFAAGGLDNAGRVTKPNANGKVFKSSVNNESTIFPVVAGKIKGVSIGHDPRKISDRGMAITKQIKVPLGELLIVGGFYFNDAIELEEAFKQSPDQFRTTSDLEHMSTQMVDPDKNSPVSYLDFSHQARRLERQQGIDLDNLN